MATTRDEEGERRRRGSLVVASQPAAAGDPTERPLDDPPPRLHREALLAFRGFDDLDRGGGGRAKALASIGSVSKAAGQERNSPRDARSKAIAPWLSCRSAGETPATSRRPSGSVSAWRPHPELVEGAPDDPPGRIVTALAGYPHATRAGSLRIDDTAGRAGLASDPRTVGQREGMGEAFEHACLGKAQEPTMHRAPRREVQRQMPLRASCPQHVQDAVKDRAQWPAPRSPYAGGAGRSGASTA
ncbi:hypothetical protein AFCDBAGC_1299 [Methylobacterium cerastii]|uniref:Uncharacterized protein n=1 Tax=Methylobacterium cerastii TaxID=932741 RepID=A0ABQ4QEW4_9HYPH|nr:hypothetical protein AFCDBAGC_1299 [Methylobacterium cerastii]